MPTTKIIVLDDDPTGSQTVHACLLLTRWDAATLQQALLDEAPLFFVLTNTRGMDAARAAAVTGEVCDHLKRALADLKAAGHHIQPILVSRSDSTLRGHYPVETDVIAAKLGPFDAHFLVPAFFEGGRFTRDSVHYLLVDGKPTPVHETEFARDSVFGYRHSYLPDYVEEKTRGRIKTGEVERFRLEDVRGDVTARLLGLTGNRCCVVDAENQADLNHFADQVEAAAGKGKRFLFRSAASLLTALAGLPPQPVAAEAMHAYTRGGLPGAVIVGSHVQKTTAQLERLLAEPGVVAVEVEVDRIQPERDLLLTEILERTTAAHAAGLTPVVFTSRVERQFPDQAERLAFGVAVSAFLMEVVRGLPPTLGFLISKGGITSNDVLSDGLALRTARVLGQVLAGCSVVRCPADHPRFPDLPVVIFPGNVGDEAALATVVRRFSEKPAAGGSARHNPRHEASLSL
ncbi:MAG: Hrp-dependent type III effector protein [bacterium]|nr:MAG: Hrp-dependent type III effector protein [bacterium]KAF0147406.1 MAG: Hrp-dependent type III effector protein [bacterium]KAF0167407.1 MAG: Hrp-dependent type III effector protein [bacterium]TXT16260.1 MAG: Hrp-dependent type III effector protein [bacterium]